MLLTPHYRAQAKPTKAEAKAMQDRLLARWFSDYPWNTQRSLPPAVQPRLQRAIEQEIDPKLSPE